MQQKISLRNVPLCKEIKQLPFRCPRCGEHERFRSLSSLRAHLDHSHTYHTLHDFSPASRWRPVEAVDQIKAWDRDGGGGCTERCKRASIETRHLRDSSEKGRLKLAAGEEVGLSQGGTGDEQGEESPQAGALVKRRLGEMLRAADSSMEKRLHRVSSELAHTDSEILRQRVRSEHLAQEKQELFEREKALSRQVDTAVMVIATLREQLTKSEQELERKEREVITIHHFLEAAVQHETCGKLRLQNFIENLLQRISLAERLLAYYQSASSQPNCTAHSMSRTVANGPQRIPKSRSAGGLLAADEPEEARKPSCQKGRSFPKLSRDSQGHSSDHKGEARSQRRQSAHYEA